MRIPFDICRVYGLLGIILSGLEVQAQNAQPIVVTAEDTSQPVACYVFGIQPDGKFISLGRTDPPGQFKFTENCVEGYQLQFFPEAASIYFQTFVFCRDALASGVKLKKIPTPEIAKLNDAILKQIDSDPGSAAYFSNLLASKISSQPEARGYEITKVIQWGKFLNVTTPIVYQTKVGGFVPSDDLVKATKVFQITKGLHVTGTIDDKTLVRGADPVTVEQFFKKQ
jgi:hypothetical protein